MIPNFWLRSRYFWPLWVIVACFLGELLFVLFFDHTPNVYRNFWGSDTLRLNLIGLFAPEQHSRQIWGWVTDFDKILPYSITIIIFVLYRQVLKKYSDPDSHVLKFFQERKYRWMVTIGGLCGAIGIILHYLCPPSNHFFNWEDKGLINAWQHLISEGPLITWMAIFGYRLWYFILSPFVYFVLFSTVVAAILTLRRVLNPSERLAEAGIQTEGVNLLIFIVLFSTGTLTILHFFLNSIFEFGRFGLNPQRARFWILMGLYLLSIIGVLSVGPRRCLKAVVSIFRQVKGKKSHFIVSLLMFITSLIFMIMPPAKYIAGDLRSSNLNAALGISFNTFSGVST